MKNRDVSLDLFKGILVIAMVYCHTIQFYGDSGLFPIEATWETLINLAAFPGFLFAFGAAVSMAYLDKPLKTVWPRMLLAALRSLGAFYLSGIAFRVLREGRAFSAATVNRVLLLSDIPGWSEFLVAFALFALLSILLFKPLKLLRERPLWVAGVSLLCLAATFLPYERVTIPQIGLLVGTNEFACFPLLQYAPYYLAGIVFASNKKACGAAALIASAVGGALALSQGGLPERFPPSLGWVLLPAGLIAALYLLAWGLAKIPFGKWERYSPLIPLASLGRESLYYLLTTNILLFTFAGRNIVPKLNLRDVGLWSMAHSSPWGTFWWAVVLLLGCAFVASLVRKR